MDIIEKAQRLEELAKSLETEDAAKNLIAAALELISELAKKVTGLEEELEELGEEVDDLDDAFEELCEDVYGDEEDETFEVECPNCGELIQIDEGILEDGGITCPGCDETLEFEMDDFGGGCGGCGCEGCHGKHSDADPDAEE